MPHLLRRHAELPVTPWKNGGGTTRELLVLTAPDGSPRLRVSMAQVASDGPFSHYPGVSRALTLLSGDPLALVVDGRACTLARGEVLTFDGEAPTDCTLTGGAVEDLGVMVWGGGRARLELRPAAGAEVPASAVAVVVTTEPVSVDGVALGVGDAVLVDTSEPLPMVAGGGTVALVLDEG